MSYTRIIGCLHISFESGLCIAEFAIVDFAAVEFVFAEFVL